MQQQPSDMPQGQWQPNNPNNPQYSPPQAPYQSPYGTPPPYQQPPQPQKKKRGKLPLIIGVLVLVIAVVVCASVVNAVTNGSTGKSATHGTAATHAPTPLPVHYPPKTKADLHGLAARGNASAVHEFHSESVGLVGACPQPKREVTIASSVTGQALAEDLLAYFYTQHLDSPCGSLVLAYHSRSESGAAYTAGRILLDVTDASGQTNSDPNASGLKYSLTLDVGGLLDGEEYAVMY